MGRHIINAQEIEELKAERFTILLLSSSSDRKRLNVVFIGGAVSYMLTTKHGVNTYTDMDVAINGYNHA